MPAPRQPRKLSRAHFVFMRCLAQSLDERDSWDRYLRLEGEHTDVRTVRRTIAWIRDLFAAAAQREQRPGTARLVQLDPRQIGVWECRSCRTTWGMRRFRRRRDT